jgi:hypothetical protein
MMSSSEYFSNFSSGQMYSSGAQGSLIAVETVDELPAMYVPLVLRARIPKMDVPIHHEILFAVLFVQETPPCDPLGAGYSIHHARVAPVFVFNPVL